MNLLRTTTIFSRHPRCQSILTARNAAQSSPAKRYFWASPVRKYGEEDVEIEDPGLYEVILPPDPPIWGVSHLKPRVVPDSIPKPSYVIRSRIGNSGVGDASSGSAADVDAPQAILIDDEKVLSNFNHDPYTGDGRIKLGSDDEKRIRRAGNLANRVLRMAGKLVGVSGLSLTFVF